MKVVSLLVLAITLAVVQARVRGSSSAVADPKEDDAHRGLQMNDNMGMNKNNNQGNQGGSGGSGGSDGAFSATSPGNTNEANGYCVPFFVDGVINRDIDTAIANGRAYGASIDHAAECESEDQTACACCRYYSNSLICDNDPQNSLWEGRLDCICKPDSADPAVNPELPDTVPGTGNSNVRGPKTCIPLELVQEQIIIKNPLIQNAIDAGLGDPVCDTNECGTDEFPGCCRLGMASNPNAMICDTTNEFEFDADCVCNAYSNTYPDPPIVVEDVNLEACEIYNENSDVYDSEEVWAYQTLYDIFPNFYERCYGGTDCGVGSCCVPSACYCQKIGTVVEEDKCIPGYTL